MDSSDFFPGPGPANSIENGTGTGSRSFTIELDFTPAGGYDGTTNFGTVTFSRDNTPSPSTFTSNQSFDFVGFSVNDSANSNVSNFSLSQIPEPSSAALLVFLGTLGLLRRRRV